MLSWRIDEEATMRSAWLGFVAGALLALVASAGCQSNPCLEVADRACKVAESLGEAGGTDEAKRCAQAKARAEKAGDAEREACARMLKMMAE
jgi:hypothetical protein